MDVKTLLVTAIQASLFLVVLAVGLRAAPADALYVLRRPPLLGRALLAIDVVVPAFAALLVSVLPLTPAVAGGILLMAVSPLPPVLPGKQLKFGDDVSYVCGLLVAVSLLSVVTVPATLAILSAIFRADASLPPEALARLVGAGVLVPLGIGMTVHGLNPRLARRLAPTVSVIANILLVISVLPVLVTVWPAVWRLVGNGSLLAIAAVVLVALAMGHLLGGPDEDQRTSLAFASATRHPGIAMMIARASGSGTQVTAAILLFMLAGAVAVIPYQAWRKRRLGKPARAGAGTPHSSHPALGRTR